MPSDASVVIVGVSPSGVQTTEFLRAAVRAAAVTASNPKQVFTGRRRVVTAFALQEALT